MDIQFVCGKIEFEKLQDVDALVCPTDTLFSGNGGLDLAIRKAAGPGLSRALAGKQLAVGETYITEAFNISAQCIVHTAVPIANSSDKQAEALRNCYRNVFRSIGSLYSKPPCKSAVITLLGSGSCGWSYEQSLAALWSVVLEYHREHGSAYFGKGSLEKLVIHYPIDASKLVYDYKPRTSQAFFNAPDKWGTRGDPRLWYALMDHFDDPRFNKISLSDFIKEIQRFFYSKAGNWLCGDTQVHVKEWDFGGMSGGWISSFMAELGIPLLCNNLCKLGFSNYADAAPCFIVPVTLRSRHAEDFQLTLPYELLPDLTILRKKQQEITAKTRIPLDAKLPYYLTVHHYCTAPELVAFYSLDVKSDNDSHYQFSAVALAKLSATLPNAADNPALALQHYLQAHGGPALETLIKKIAEKEFHY